ncbi:uncharacterized protein LOC133852783 isoform X2 [Alnus glutinosa]|uniref:uncharacterized protein LOC133852783 isoform X2 n=1 Tax=Alnus glutinosa TaxID=3517 RepID=UPI002D78CC2C|nr:uncharacterized protein LOC133852783 isoform X2 [Alnus glutinosa]
MENPFIVILCILALITSLTGSFAVVIGLVRQITETTNLYMELLNLLTQLIPRNRITTPASNSQAQSSTGISVPLAFLIISLIIIWLLSSSSPSHLGDPPPPIVSTPYQSSATRESFTSRQSFATHGSFPSRQSSVSLGSSTSPQSSTSRGSFTSYQSSPSNWSVIGHAGSRGSFTSFQSSPSNWSVIGHAGSRGSFTSFQSSPSNWSVIGHAGSNKHNYQSRELALASQNWRTMAMQSLSPRAKTYPAPPQIVSTPHQSFTSHQSSPSNWSIINNAGSNEQYYRRRKLAVASQKWRTMVVQSLSPRAKTYPAPPQIVSTPHKSFTSHQSSPSNWSIINNVGSNEQYYRRRELAVASQKWRTMAVQSLSPRVETYPAPPQIASTPHQSFTSHQSSPSNWSIINNAGSNEQYYRRRVKTKKCPNTFRP